MRWVLIFQKMVSLAQSTFIKQLWKQNWDMEKSVRKRPLAPTCSACLSDRPTHLHVEDESICAKLSGDAIALTFRSLAELPGCYRVTDSGLLMKWSIQCFASRIKFQPPLLSARHYLISMVKHSPAFIAVKAHVLRVVITRYPRMWLSA